MASSYGCRKDSQRSAIALHAGGGLFSSRSREERGRTCTRNGLPGEHYRIVASLFTYYSHCQLGLSSCTGPQQWVIVRHQCQATRAALHRKKSTRVLFFSLTRLLARVVRSLCPGLVDNARGRLSTPLIDVLTLRSSLESQISMRPKRKRSAFFFLALR